MKAEQLIDQVFATCRFQPTQEARDEVTVILCECYASGESAHTAAKEVLQYLELPPEEHLHQLELVLRTDFF